jgi:hypothetical protein
MPILDLLIAYFSIGAPVLVAYIITSRCGTTISAVGYAVAVFTFWPLFGGMLLYQKYGRKLYRYSGTEISSHSYTRNSDRIDIIRIKIEEIIRTGHRPSEIYHWRSEFDRYASVLLALSSSVGGMADFELTKVVHHPDPDIANACHQRRILRRLLLQLNSTREEFLTSTKLLCSTSDALVDAEQLLLSLALLLDDRLGEAKVREMFAETDGQNAVSASVSSIGSEIWQPQI